MAQTQARRSIPQPRPSFLFGNAGEVHAESSAQDLIRLAREYGPIYALDLPEGHTIVLSGFRLVDEVCDDQRFDKLVAGGVRQARIIAGDGLFTADTDDPSWGKAHRILLPSFSPRAMQRYFPTMLDVAEQLVGKWSRLNPGDEIDVVADILRLTVDTIALCGFGFRFNSFYREQPHPFVQDLGRVFCLLRELDHEALIRPALRLIRRRELTDALDRMDALADQIIGDRKRDIREGIVHDDLLDAMLTGVDRATGERLSDENVRYQIMTFLIAGHETTSSLLPSAIYFVLKDPHARARATDEVDRVLGRDFGARPTFQQVQQLAYLTQVLKETLRLAPPVVQFRRHAREDTVIGGQYAVRSTDRLVVLTPLLHRDPAVWGDRASVFDPENFRRDVEEQRPANAWKPFGTGQRACLGRPFAMLEATLALGTILQRFTLVDHTGYQPRFSIAGATKLKGFKIRIEARPGEVARAAAAEPSAPSAAPVPAVEGSPTSVAGRLIPLLILYGSNMGTSEAGAQYIGDQARARAFATTVAPLDDFVGRLPTNGAVVILTSSYNGTPPDNAVRFCDWLESGGLGLDSLEGVTYTVFGCGNHDWASTYQRIPRLVDERLASFGARRFYPRGEGDAAEDLLNAFEDWYKPFWPALARALALDVPRPAMDEPTIRYAVEMVAERPAHPLAIEFGARTMSVLETRELQRRSGPNPSERSTRHLVLELPPGQTYRTGDHLGILPHNHPALIKRIAQRFGVDPFSTIRLSATTPGATILPLNTPIRITDLLLDYVELQEVATRTQVGILAEYARCPPEKQRLLALAGDDDASRAAYRAEVLAHRKSVLDLLDEYPSCELPFAAYLSMLTRLSPRYYSISSSPLVEDGRCSITVGVLEAPALSGHGLFRGTCSSYLGQQVAGGSILAFVKDTKSSFRLPPDPATPIIMVGPGTGIAPFRGFLQERAAQKAQGVAVGQAYLFFGCRRPDQDYLYRSELEEFARQGVTWLSCAFSRVEGRPKCYVQNQIHDNRDVVWNLLQDGAIVYVCGDARCMEPDVRAAFTAIYREYAGADAAAAEQWMADMIDEGRYRVDVWAST